MSSVLPESRISHFFETARERYSILLRRQSGQAWPWTEDPIFQRWAFCNVFYTDDRTTRWIHENLLDPLKDSPHVLAAAVVARRFGRVEALEPLVPMLSAGRWSTAQAIPLLRNVRPLTSGAYRGSTPKGLPKLEGVCSVLDEIVPDCAGIATRTMPGVDTMWSMFDQLRLYPHFGPFVSYLIVSDLRRTWMLDRAPDVRTWAYAGAETAVGLSRIVTGRPGYFAYKARDSQETMVLLMREILGYSEESELWPAEWPVWEMREVSHWLSEYGRYLDVSQPDAQLKKVYRPR